MRRWRAHHHLCQHGEAPSLHRQFRRVFQPTPQDFRFRIGHQRRRSPYFLEHRQLGIPTNAKLRPENAEILELFP